MSVSKMWLIGVIFGCFIVAGSLLACWDFIGDHVFVEHGSPRLNVSFRKSQIPFKGMVANVCNVSKEKVKIAVVSVKRENTIRYYRLDRKVKSCDSITIGWIECDGWKLIVGDEIGIWCSRYSEPFKCVVAK